MLFLFVSGEISLDKFEVKRTEFDDLAPKNDESLDHYIMSFARKQRRDAHGIEIPERRIKLLIVGFTRHRHMNDFVVGLKSGEKKLPADFSSFKAMACSQDRAKHEGRDDKEQ